MKQNHTLLILASIWCSCLCSAPFASADDYKFTGSGTNMNWFNPNGWDSGQLPTSDVNVLLAAVQPGTAPVVIDNTADPAYKGMVANTHRFYVGGCGGDGLLLIKSDITCADGFHVGCGRNDAPDEPHTGNGTVTQMSGTMSPGQSEIGTTPGLTGIYELKGGTFSIADTSLSIGGDIQTGTGTPGAAFFTISGGQMQITGHSIQFGSGTNANFCVIGSAAKQIATDHFNESRDDGSTGKVNLRVQIDKGGLTPIQTDDVNFSGVTLIPSFARDVTPYAGTWIVMIFGNDFQGDAPAPKFGAEVDKTRWSMQIDTDKKQLTVKYDPAGNNAAVPVPAH